MDDELKAGDKVLVNGGLTAEIVAINYDDNMVVYKWDVAGGGVDTTFAHLSNTRLELIEASPEAGADEDDEDEDDDDATDQSDAD